MAFADLSIFMHSSMLVCFASSSSESWPPPIGSADLAAGEPHRCRPFLNWLVVSCLCGRQPLTGRSWAGRWAHGRSSIFASLPVSIREPSKAFPISLVSSHSLRIRKTACYLAQSYDSLPQSSGLSSLLFRVVVSDPPPPSCCSSLYQSISESPIPKHVSRSRAGRQCLRPRGLSIPRPPRGLQGCGAGKVGTRLPSRNDGPHC